MDIDGGVRIVDGSEAKIVSGIDDHFEVRDLGQGGCSGDRPAGVPVAGESAMSREIMRGACSSTTA